MSSVLHVPSLRLLKVTICASGSRVSSVLHVPSPSLIPRREDVYEEIQLSSEEVKIFCSVNGKKKMCLYFSKHDLACSSLSASLFHYPTIVA